MRREFTLTHVVRGYDECNCFGLLTPAAFLRLLQDISAHDILLDTKLEYDGSLVIRRSIVNFKAPVKKFTRLELKTFGTGFGRVSSQRGYEVRLAGHCFSCRFPLGSGFRLHCVSPLSRASESGRGPSLCPLV